MPNSVLTIRTTVDFGHSLQLCRSGTGEVTAPSLRGAAGDAAIQAELLRYARNGTWSIAWMAMLDHPPAGWSARSMCSAVPGLPARIDGADGGNRTRTPLGEEDFKSPASTVPPRPLMSPVTAATAAGLFRRDLAEI